MTESPIVRATEKYAAWERSAGVITLVCAAALVAALLVGPVLPRVLMGGSLSGLLVFASWRLVLSSRVSAGLVVGVFGVLGYVWAMAPFPSHSRAFFYGHVLPQGLGALAACLFACILVRRAAKSSSGKRRD
jgi:hypothetical protein